LISEQFGYYHVGVFLLDPTREFAVLRAANSEGGQKMLARSHRLKVGETGIVGNVTEYGRPRVASDVGTDSVFFANPDLPNTRSEVAIPLKVGERIIGALDVQSTQSSAFSSEDVEVLEVLADQVSIAIENARLFSETRQALDEVQATYRQYLRQEWSRSAVQTTRGYRYSAQKVDMLSEPLDRPEVQNALESGEVVVQEDQAALAIPLKIRGETIGIVNVRNPSTDRKWTRNEINAVQAIVERATLALENARLLQTAQRRAARERTISDITAKIGATVQLDSILQTTVHELGRVFGDSEIILQLSGEQAGEKKSAE
jgi:GAF domain-containing protein